MNHVPDEVLSAIDRLGEGLLLGSPEPVGGRLRSDLQLRIDDIGETTARCVFTTEHTQAPATLRDRGTYVKTIVDNVDEQLRSWGIEPPPAYEYAGTSDGRHRYVGTLSLP